jgi:hypothetical protein
MVPIKGCEPEKIGSIFEKGENTPETLSDLNKNYTTRFSISEKPVVEASCSYVQ